MKYSMFKRMYTVLLNDLSVKSESHSPNNKDKLGDKLKDTHSWRWLLTEPSDFVCTSKHFLLLADVV